MRITTEKNLAFADQSAPLQPEEVREQIKDQEARRPLDEAQVDLSLMIPTAGQPRIETAFEARAKLDKAEAYLDKAEAYELRLRVGNFKLGEHAFPPALEVAGLEPLGNKSRTFSEPLQTEGFFPDHLALRTTPGRLPKELRTPPFIRAYPSADDRKRGNQATTIFPPDNRFTFNDTSYPWSTCGRVDTPLGFGSGVMVGPRHLLTVSHVIQWNDNNTAGWVQFRPAFFNGSAPFGTAFGTKVYFKNKVTGPTIDWTEGMYDYVVVVLNSPLGNLTGWMGGRGYTDSWDGNPYWSHVGYPGDLAGGNQPSFQNRIALDGSFWQVDSHESMSHTADVWPGQSGGPFFAWWSGQVGPSAVAVQSSHNASENNASGGQDLVDLIIKAKNENP